MHTVTDENGNVIHGHHTHGHGDEHCHEEEHTHCHPDGCEACEEDPEKETIALVSYMAEHNRQHTAELAEMGKKLAELGKTDAAEQIDKAVSDFESGNVRLAVALSLLKTEQKEA